VRRPIVGYVGSVRNEVDLTLLAKTARLAPDLSFLIVGPILADVGELASCSNVRFVGSVSHDEVIRYLTVFDVGIIPYVQNPYTAHIMPFKLMEYLAAGLPIVATGLPEIRRFVSEHGDVVAIAEDAATFVTALRNAIANDGSIERARRVKVAKHYEWADGIKAMSLRIATVMALRHSNDGTRRLA
jgi:glycosyltransferase involved in cell wall biosynthesis